MTERYKKQEAATFAAINPAMLVDISEVSVDKNLPKQERIVEYVRQIKDPYCFKCGNFVVKARFADDGISLEDCLRGILL